MSARPFTEPEYATLSSHFLSAGQTRDRLILVLGCGTGFRIQELLSITVGQVWNGTSRPPEIVIARRDLKGGAGAYKRSVRSRRVPLSEPVRNAIQAHLAVIGTGDPSLPLFGSNRSGAGGMNRSQVFRNIVAACEACGIDSSRVSTHSFRKTFVRRVYEASGHDLISTQRIVGHSSPITTARYLETDSDELDRLVLGLAA